MTGACDCLHEWGAEKASCMASEVMRLPPLHTVGLPTWGPRPHGEAACRCLADSPRQGQPALTARHGSLLTLVPTFTLSGGETRYSHRAPSK